MAKPFNSFWGDRPGRLIFKLLVFSLLVGIVLNMFGVSPLDLVNMVYNFFFQLWNMGFVAFYKLFNLLLVGAMIVVPVFLLMRLLRPRR